MARLQVIFDEEFNIIGTAPMDPVKISDADEIVARLSPRSGQQLIEIEVPDDVAATEDGAKLHATLRSMMQGLN
jgi:hypothetical protein